MQTDEQTPSRHIRALKTLSAGNHTLLYARSELQLVEDMCHVIVEKGGYAVASVAYAEHDEHKSMRWVAVVGNLDAKLLDSLHYTWDDSSRSITGISIRTRKPW